MSGLCSDPLGSPREGKEERRIDGGREVAWTPKMYDRLPPLMIHLFDKSGKGGKIVHTNKQWTNGGRTTRQQPALTVTVELFLVW